MRKLREILPRSCCVALDRRKREKPEIMTRNQIALVFAVSAVLAAVLGAAGCGSGSGAVNANANTQAVIIDVTTTPAVVKPIPTYFEATGNLASEEQTDVAPAVSGKIVEGNFDVGSYVQKGSVLMRLDDRDARLKLDQAI